MNAPGEAYEEYDDMMFEMAVSNTRQTNNPKGSKNNPTTPVTGNSIYVSETGQTKDAWFREEEVMRKKLEKSAIA